MGLEGIGETGLEEGDKNNEQGTGDLENKQIVGTEIEEICGSEESQLLSQVENYELESDMDESDEYLPEGYSGSNIDESSDLENENPNEIRDQIENETENVNEEAENEENNNEGPSRKKRRRIYLKQDRNYLQNKKKQGTW